MSSKNNIKIALLADCYGGKFVGGGQIHIQNLTKSLEKNHNCQIKIFSQPYSNILIRFLWSFWVILQVFLSQKRSKFNLIHSHGYIPGFSAKVISDILKIPVIHTVHGSNLIDQNKKSVKAKLEKYLLTQIKYDTQIVVNQNFLKYKNKTKNQIVIPNGVNLPKNSKPKNQNYNLLNILFVGRLEKIKGLDYLFKALSKVNFNFTLSIVGDGSQKNNLVKLSQKLDICNKIKFYLPTKNLSKFYSNSDLFILPSITEGQPITILEAASFKLPIITTSVGSNPYIIKDKIDGILVKPKKINQLQNAIKWIFDNREKSIKMGEKVYLKIKKDFTWDKISQKTYFVYQSVLSNRHSESSQFGDEESRTLS